MDNIPVVAHLGQTKHVDLTLINIFAITNNLSSLGLPKIEIKRMIAKL